MAFTKIMKLLLFFFLGLATLIVLFVLILAKNGFSTYNTEEYKIPPQMETSWEQIFASPKAITLKSVCTGNASGDRHMVLDSDDRNISKLGNRYAPTPMIVHLINHSEKGRRQITPFLVHKIM